MVKSEYWTVAYRKREAGKTILDDINSTFSIIPNPKRYWCADPFVFTYQDRTFLFAEMYDNKPHRGVIGYCELTDGGPTEWKVIIREKYHLSYPYIFAWNDDIYMIPESYVANEIGLYKAKKFPDTWEKVDTILQNFCTVDSTMFMRENKFWMLTQKQPEGTLILYPMDADCKIAGNAVVAQTSAEQNRPAGKLFEWRGKHIRPAQDCSEGYGSALNFYEVDKVSTTEFQEHIIRKINAKDIASNHALPAEGIHTYNFTDKYEVIDIKNYKIERFWFFKRVYRALYWRVEKLFGVLNEL
ncbi:MAG: hypothetical protein IJ325_13270 [Clostridia bacterium]|nr:hypothetical protein [Clostridia bacterium]